MHKAALVDATTAAETQSAKKRRRPLGLNVKNGRRRLKDGVRRRRAKMLSRLWNNAVRRRRRERMIVGECCERETTALVGRLRSDWRADRC